MHRISITIIIMLFVCGMMVACTDRLQGEDISNAVEEPMPCEKPDPVPSDSISVLLIGNSYAKDALDSHLDSMLAHTGLPFVVGRLHISSCSLMMHYDNALSGVAAYDYRCYDNSGRIRDENGVALIYALSERSWRVIGLQQASYDSGIYATYAETLPSFMEWLRKNTRVNNKFLWHQTWSYGPHCEISNFGIYGYSSADMYAAIAEASAKAYAAFEFDCIAPVGTAIQLARGTSLGDDLTADGVHLDIWIGRYIAACVWFETLTGIDVTTSDYNPSGLSKRKAEIARVCAHAACSSPFSIDDISIAY